MRETPRARITVTLRKRAMRGFTFIELGAVLLIIGILLGLGIPLYSDATLSSRLSAYANNLVSSIHLARSEAMKRNAAVTLCASANGSTCAGSGNWGQGWIVRVGTTVLQRQQAFADGFRATGTGGLTLSFQPTGVGATQSTMTVCRYAPDAGKQERVITISATGKPSLERTETGTCP